MTSISDTNVVNAPGGLVELAFVNGSDLSITATTASGGDTIINTVTIVSDGSPLLVEFDAGIVSPPPVSTALMSISLWVDGSLYYTYWGSYRTSQGSSFYQDQSSALKARLSLSAGVHTFKVTGFVSSGTGTIHSSPTYSPTIFRVSKIIQASQLIVQTPNASLVTSLPSNAIDGQEVRYLADNTNGIIWNLRYRAGSSSSYKWEFIGGSPLRNENSNYPAGQNNSSFTDITNGATVTPPLAGDYMVEHYGRTDSTNPTVSAVIEVSAATSAIAASSYTGAIGFEATYTGVIRGAWARTQKLSGVAANDIIKLQQKIAVGSFSTVFFYTAMNVTPIRVG